MRTCFEYIDLANRLGYMWEYRVMYMSVCLLHVYYILLLIYVILCIRIYTIHSTLHYLIIYTLYRCHYYMWQTNRWLNFRTQLIGAIVTGAIAWVVVLQAERIGM